MRTAMKEMVDTNKYRRWQGNGWIDVYPDAELWVGFDYAAYCTAPGKIWRWYVLGIFTALFTGRKLRSITFWKWEWHF